MPTVDQVGVRNLWCTRAKRDGTALWAAMEKTVRASGRMVVWVDATAEVSTVKMSNLVRNQPGPVVPKTAPPRPESTSPELAGLPRPVPAVPIPANACADVATRA